MLKSVCGAQTGDDLASILIVSDVKIGELPEGAETYVTPVLPDVQIAVTKAEGEKCPRCWHYHPQVGKEEREICPRCSEVVKQ